MEKEGLQAAVDFTKFLLTLAGGAIAFIIQPTFFAGHPFLQQLSIGALVLLAVSTVSGLLVLSRGCVLLAKKDYNLEDTYIKVPGLVNVIGFGLGFVLLALAVGIRVAKA